MLRQILYRGRSAATSHFPLQFQNLIITKIHTKALRFNAPPLSRRKYKDYYNYPDMLNSKISVDYNIPRFLRQLLIRRASKKRANNINTHVSIVNAAFAVPHQPKRMNRYL